MTLTSSNRLHKNPQDTNRALVTMNSLKLPLAVACVLSIWTTGYATSCGERQKAINGRCCDKCPPGHYLENFCTENAPTLCQPCKEGYFADQYNIFDRCKECKSCQQDYSTKCTATTDATCACFSGSLCSHSNCSVCKENKGPKSVEPTETPRDDALVFLSVGFVLVSITLLLATSITCVKKLRKRRANNKPIPVVTVCTNTSEFHLSKEESGLPFITQDESKMNDECVAV
ncbi:uncharacterized protein LOC125007126 [Mugil cephalus]|uniref:uncharacterized protein LOC125007126 n=1 Tax=Mugil cephalus TaxID=48193 RepID=UPI001FB80476|nr:uncharacterized protein LOC125007126 [Mugil cephalus]